MADKYNAVNRVVIIAAEDSPPSPGEAYDAVEALLTDEEADVVYFDTFEDDHIIEKDTETIGSDIVRGSSDGTRHAVLKNGADVSFEFPLRAQTDAGEPPVSAPVLQGAGFEMEIDADDVIFTRSTKNPPAFTIYEYQRSAYTDNWRLEVATGVRGSISANLDNESEARISFDGRGNFHEITDEAEFIDVTSGEVALLKDGSTAVTERTTGEFVQPKLAPMPCRDMVAEFDTDTYEFSEMEVDVNHEQDDTMTVTGSSGRSSGGTSRGADARTEGSLELVEYNETRVSDVRDKAYGGDVFVMNVGLRNGDGEIDITSDNAQFLPWDKTTNGNFRAYSIPFRLNGSHNLVTDDELIITFSPPAA